MKQQFIGLQYCKCGISWKIDIGLFERTPDMVFGLRCNVPGRKTRKRDSLGTSMKLTAAPAKLRQRCGRKSHVTDLRHFDEVR